MTPVSTAAKLASETLRDLLSVFTPAATRIAPNDDVAVALRDLTAHEALEIDGTRITTASAIPRGHKLALHEIARDQAVRKHGAVIGRTIAPIAAGEHVHTHNLATLLSGMRRYEFENRASQPRLIDSAPTTFQGYRRANGRVGTRNEIWILCTVGCVGRTAEKIARLAEARFADRIDGIHAFPHQFGCSQLGGDLERTRKLIAALACHPNAGGVLILGLGCESNQLDKLLADIPEQERAHIRYFAAQATADETQTGLAMVEELVALAERAQRVPCPLSDLAIGVKCGGSDGFSGLTANQLVGRITDHITASGGTSILTEIPEIFGAEHLLMQRAADETVFNDIGAVVNDFKAYFLRNEQPVSENPSPGNIAGGITTLEEKSLGAVQKGGNAVVTEVLRYGERATRPGLVLLEAPGNDGVSSTALVAAGATTLLFTTGRGTPLGFPVPTLKISSNSALAANKPHWIDFDAGRLLGAVNRQALETELARLVVATASGERARNEINEEREIAIWKDGVTL